MLPVRGATGKFGETMDAAENFNPCSPCGERPGGGFSGSNGAGNFNPCSPCGERRVDSEELLLSEIKFQSMLPVRGATLSSMPITRLMYFNPCSPCGERQFGTITDRDYKVFQSMLPVRGATKPRGSGSHHVVISIHAPRAGSDEGFQSTRNSLSYFNPCSPCGERP